jgi:predicted Zn-dependent peptidase
MIFQVSQLPNRLRVATAEMPQMQSVCVGLWIGVGGRYEPLRLSGISHFTEHLLFKGTRRRSARQISQTVEGVGGYLNAFTGEESTCYFARASAPHLPLLLDVLTDMYLQPRLAPADIDKERQVIKEELLMYRDQPDQYVHELLTETLWPGHPLGRLLTGTPESLDAMSRPALLAFKRNSYIAANTVVAAAGHCRHEDIVHRVEKLLRPAPTGRAPGFQPAPNEQRRPRLRYTIRPVEQTHLALALRAYSRHDRRRFALKLLSVILGENMSSRLFQALRERHGLAYSIHTTASFFADTGALYVSAGLDTKRLARSVALILREMTRLTREAPSAAELRRAKDYAIGQMRLGLESTANQMSWLGEQLLAFGRIHTPERLERQLEAVSPEDVQAVADNLMRDHRLNTAVISPVAEEPALTDLLHLDR